MGGPDSLFRTTAGPPPENEGLPPEEGWTIPYKAQPLYAFFDDKKKAKAAMTKEEILKAKRPRKEQAAAFKLTRHPQGGTQKLQNFAMEHRPAIGAASSWLENYKAHADPLRESLAKELEAVRKARQPVDDSKHPDVIARKMAEEAVQEACETGEKEAEKKEAEKKEAEKKEAEKKQKAEAEKKQKAEAEKKEAEKKAAEKKLKEEAEKKEAEKKEAEKKQKEEAAKKEAEKKEAEKKEAEKKAKAEAEKKEAEKKQVDKKPEEKKPEEKKPEEKKPEEKKPEEKILEKKLPEEKP